MNFRVRIDTCFEGYAFDFIGSFSLCTDHIYFNKILVTCKRKKGLDF